MAEVPNAMSGIGEGVALSGRFESLRPMFGQQLARDYALGYPKKKEREEKPINLDDFKDNGKTLYPLWARQRQQLASELGNYVMAQKKTGKTNSQIEEDLRINVLPAFSERVKQINNSNDNYHRWATDDKLYANPQVRDVFNRAANNPDLPLDEWKKLTSQGQGILAGDGFIFGADELPDVDFKKIITDAAMKDVNQKLKINPQTGKPYMRTTKLPWGSSFYEYQLEPTIEAAQATAQEILSSDRTKKLYERKYRADNPYATDLYFTESDANKRAAIQQEEVTKWVHDQMPKTFWKNATERPVFAPGTAGERTKQQLIGRYEENVPMQLTAYDTSGESASSVVVPFKMQARTSSPQKVSAAGIVLDATTGKPVPGVPETFDIDPSDVIVQKIKVGDKTTEQKRILGNITYYAPATDDDAKKELLGDKKALLQNKYLADHPELMSVDDIPQADISDIARRAESDITKQDIYNKKQQMGKSVKTRSVTVSYEHNKGIYGNNSSIIDSQFEEWENKKKPERKNKKKPAGW